MPSVIAQTSQVRFELRPRAIFPGTDGKKSHCCISSERLPVREFRSGRGQCVIIRKLHHEEVINIFLFHIYGWTLQCSAFALMSTTYRYSL